MYRYNRIRKGHSATLNYKRTASLRTYYELNRIKHDGKATYVYGDLVVLKSIIRKNCTLYLDGIQIEMMKVRRKI